MFVPVLKDGMHAAIFPGGDSRRVRRGHPTRGYRPRPLRSALHKRGEDLGRAERPGRLADDAHQMGPGRAKVGMDRSAHAGPRGAGNRLDRTIQEFGSLSYSQYPAASHTFIRCEVEALRELGWVSTHSACAGPGPTDHQRCGHGRGRRTYYLLNQSPGAIWRRRSRIVQPAGRLSFGLEVGPRSPCAGSPRAVPRARAFHGKRPPCPPVEEATDDPPSQPFRQLRGDRRPSGEQASRHSLELHDARHFRDGLSGRPDARAQDRGGRIRRLRLLVRPGAGNAARRPGPLGENPRRPLRPALRPTPA